MHKLESRYTYSPEQLWIQWRMKQVLEGYTIVHWYADTLDGC